MACFVPSSSSVDVVWPIFLNGFLHDFKSNWYYIDSNQKDIPIKTKATTETRASLYIGTPVLAPRPDEMLVNTESGIRSSGVARFLDLHRDRFRFTHCLMWISNKTASGVDYYSNKLLFRFAFEFDGARNVFADNIKNWLEWFDLLICDSQHVVSNTQRV